MSLIDLPEIEYVSEDVAATLNNMVTVVEGILGRTLAPADPLRLFLLAQAALITQLKSAINKTARANLLRYAPGDVLDHMGAFTETPRLPATAAATTIRFTLSAVQLSAVTIPAGTRVTIQSEPKQYFATDTIAVIAPGATTVDVAATCTVTGSAGNDYVPGQISQLVDPIAFVSTAVNITTSAGGADEEDDDPYRERIHNAPEKFSVAGPDGAYKYWAKTASSLIVDVSVSSPDPCEVLIVPLLEGGEIPGTEILEAVEEICSSKTVRPLTDQVTVVAPTAVSYTITLTYWINLDNAAASVAIQSAVTAAINDYILWQKSKLGRDIDPSELIYRIKAAGASRVSVTSPSYTAVDTTAVAVAGTVTATYGGLADD
jgi:phage-related baseplate assembly protein